MPGSQTRGSRGQGDKGSMADYSKAGGRRVPGTPRRPVNEGAKSALAAPSRETLRGHHEEMEGDP